MIKRFKEKIRAHFHEAVRIEDSRHSIASGFAIGTFIAILPTPGFGFLLGLIITLLFKNVNKISLFMALIIWNPIILTPLYLLSYEIGHLLFGSLPVVIFKIKVLDHIYNFSRRFLVGNFLLASAISLISYFMIRLAAHLYKIKKGLKKI